MRIYSFLSLTGSDPICYHHSSIARAPRPRPRPGVTAAPDQLTTRHVT